MKRKLIELITIIMMIFMYSYTYAQEESVDVSQWNYLMLLGSSDQDESIKINMLFSMIDQSKRAFCLEPKEYYKPRTAIYTRTPLEDDYIYQIVKAYEKVGLEDNNYYIAAQLMIWKRITGIDYTFDGNDYSDYKDELLSLIENNEELKSKSVSNEVEGYLDEEGYIEGDFSEFDVTSDDVEILFKDDYGFSYKINNEEPEIKIINIIPKDSDDNHSIVLTSKQSQDIYYFDGEYSDLKPYEIKVKTLIKEEPIEDETIEEPKVEDEPFIIRPIIINPIKPNKNKYIDLKYSKVDENNNVIAGAQFSVYEISDEKSNEELLFIQNGVKINWKKALLDKSLWYEDLRIETSERFDKYIDANTIKTNEIGYFPYKIYNGDKLLKEGICYVSNNILLTNGSYKKYATRRIFRGYSEDLKINTITNLPADNNYLLCESEPKNGYVYTSEPCVIVNSKKYNDKVYKFTNNSRKYNFKLVKQSPEYIPLDGAVFNLKYVEDGIDKQITFTTGSLLIPRLNKNEYLIYRHESSSEATVVKFDGDYFSLEDAKVGKYYYYQSNENVVNDNLLSKEYAEVIEGGFCIDNLPYSSSLTLEEIKAPIGFMLDDDPVYHIDPDIPYSEITLKNYRVNSIDIIPEKTFKIPLTCIN